jgi:hypothetical protein
LANNGCTEKYFEAFLIVSMIIRTPYPPKGGT